MSKIIEIKPNLNLIIHDSHIKINDRPQGSLVISKSDFRCMITEFNRSEKEA